MNQTLAIFLTFIGAVLGISFWLGRRARSAQGYYAAHGSIPWFVNGVAFAGDYLSAASFLGICGLIATGGYDGFLYSIGFLAGWVVALFVIAEPIKRLGTFTFADALDRRFASRGIKLSAAISTLVVSIFYLIPQMVGAGALMHTLLGWPHIAGVATVGVVVIIIVATAGMVSTTWVQFIKGSLLVALCTLLVVLILGRGLTTHPSGSAQRPFRQFRTLSDAEIEREQPTLATDQAFADHHYRFTKGVDGAVTLWKHDGGSWRECQFIAPISANGEHAGSAADLTPVGHIDRLPGGGSDSGPLSPAGFLSTLQDSEIMLWGSEKFTDSHGDACTVYFPKPTSGAAVLSPGLGMFKGIDASNATKLNFISLMLALFCGTASLPHILIRYYTVKDHAAARKSTVVGIAAIGFFYVLTLFIGLGAMTSGVLDLNDPKGNMAAPLLARSFGEPLFALISAIAFTTILGTVSGLIMAASGAVVHDLITNVFKRPLDDAGKVRAGKWIALIVGVVAMALGVAFEHMNVSFLVGWAFSIAASANLPALVMLLFWKGTTRQGITAAIVVGMVTSLGWILLSGDTYKNVYGWDEKTALVPFSQPGIVTIPLGFLVLVVVSLCTRQRQPATA